ncbi:MAG: hypothetical protein L0J79_05235 [Propionibacterium sp.]|nr:hypothetical protein [Propionibacterium sp.]
MNTTDLHRLTDAIADLDTTNQTLDHLKQRKAELEDLIREFVPAGTKNAQYGDPTVTVTNPQRRLNTTALTKAFPVIEFPSLYKPSIDTTAVKKAISENELEERGLYTLTTPGVRVN